MKTTTAGSVRRLFIPLIILCSLSSMSGCNSTPTNTSIGKYVDKINPQDFNELKKDGTFLIHQGKENASGKYSIEGKRLVLILSSGQIVTGSIDGKTITDNGGGQLIKQ